MSEASYRYGGARVLVELRDWRLREFLAVWREADERRLERRAPASGFALEAA